MFALYRKELSGFLSSLSGYVVIIVFTTLNGLFLWLVPGEMNLLEGGYATLSPLFQVSPWMFLFLIPAITMRMISEERKASTIDVLLTQPRSELELILAKYFASLSLAVIALIPTVIYLISVGMLGSPSFNLDMGAILGSYIGLFFLAACYTSIGIFASSLSENTIVAFIVAVLLCFIIYSGFDYASRMFESGATGELILNLGIDAHYQSISRGVVDSRDIVYFLSVISIFIAGTSLKIKSILWN